MSERQKNKGTKQYPIQRTQEFGWCRVIDSKCEDNSYGELEEENKTTGLAQAPRLSRGDAEAGFRRTRYGT